MHITDPVADMLTRIRNALIARHDTVTLPASNMKKAIADMQLDWVHLSDLKGWQSEAGQVYGIRSIPASYLVDPTGKIIAADLRGEQLEAKLKEIYGE